MSEGSENQVPDKRHKAACGLFCPACFVFIATQEQPEQLYELANRLKRPVEEMRCQGCSSNTLFTFCRSGCQMRKCSVENGYDFCGECPKYPCKEFVEFYPKHLHRQEVRESQERIKEVGYDQWYAEMIKHYSCPECNTINSAYDRFCRKCGATPSCEYVRRHNVEVDEAFEKEQGS